MKKKKHQDITDRGTVWFRRFRRECEALSPHVKFRSIKFGFYRIYYKGFYIGECYKEMPPHGYDTEEDDVNLSKQSYFEEYEDSAEMTRKLKNFVEGYYDAKKTFRTRMYMLRTDDEFYKTSKKAYQQMYVK